ncbi:2-polyprenyl-6-methoxyphenol hydroxylase-like FAD-dependent oxidoreductase [Pararhizobium capsulatum DSM 1112]|uniref:2-polyprenyl-6-methoxyphenol hydroxylase-like FAD-dependent oxidoreductase n=1 Tax=Pararhizobium capsulatum DSM 1112 TaxID=1121113 RepID=A0ABU0BZF8_9HYPH|nr:FAD-dependent monooxygenase [Pararhizobium capsulatum]MDQ0323094.1 2-polyprenyl-6-methoxyphenol hydroxylase-like FAD-dependent oxidoreductase [Pararhizobium capsulatum DSM 1112]
MHHDTQVIIIGGSLVGLSAAAFLAWRGIKTIVVEKHGGSALHPRATGFTEHTLEFYRAIGIADRIPIADPSFRLRRATVTSLVGEVKNEARWTPSSGPIPARQERALSPAGMAGFAQDKLEPILRERAGELGAELLLGTELLSFEDRSDGIVATVRNRENDRIYSLCANYMIAADGAGSAVREELGVELHGVGHIMNIRSVLFQCPAADKFLERGFQQFEIEQEGFKAFLTTYGDSRWVLMFYGGEVKRSREYASDIRRALGADLPFEIITSGAWEMAGRIADVYSKGRVFLAGDAAHQLPPTRGGYGANTGIDDVWNLAWKLDLVLDGTSKPTLLDTYSAERQPVGWLRHQQTFARPDYARYVGNTLSNETVYDDKAMELGQLHRSDIIIDAASSLPAAAHPDEWAGQPGTRAPHLWIDAHRRQSTIDLFTRGFVFITEDALWESAAQAASDETGFTFAIIRIGRDILINDTISFADAFGVGVEGAALVRPDGLVCWRTQLTPSAVSENLSDVLRKVAKLVL